MTNFNDLEMIGCIDIAGSWEFDYLGVFLDRDTMQLYVGQDSGCSCPIPWENHSMEDLRAVTLSEALEALKKHVEGVAADSWSGMTQDDLDADVVQTFAHIKAVVEA